MSNIIDSIQISGVTYTISGQSSGANAVEVTQAEYDALVTGGTVDPNAFYIITDATPADMSQYWTSAQTQSAITQAVSGKASQTDLDTVSGQVENKQDTLVSGTNIKTINNTSILGSGNIDIQGGGGKAIEAGRGITVTTSETADTVSFNLPISAGTGANSIIEGRTNYAQKWCSHAEGEQTISNGMCSHTEGGFTSANANYSHAEGYYTKATNESEHASGRYNVSSSASTTFGDSGNTLFSVGNGTAENTRHNAFEIRQNGDIYIQSGNTDIKLQDNLGGISSAECQTMIDNSITGKTNQSDFSAYTAATDTALAAKQDTLVSGTNIKTINNESLLGSGNITIQGGGTTYTAGTGIDIMNDVISVSSGVVTTDTSQDITGTKTFVGEKKIKFKQSAASTKLGFTLYNSASTNNELATFELRPNTFGTSPLLYLGHYRSTAIANAGVPQTYVGFRQYDQSNAAAYHYLIPLPEKAKTPFSLTTSFKDYYAPIGFKNGSTMITADDTGVVDLSSEFGGLKLVKLTQAEYDALSTKDSNTLYIIIN